MQPRAWHQRCQPLHELQRRHRLQAAVDEALRGLLGELPTWLHAVVHRWRYALPQPAGTLARRQAWWDARRGLCACGDFLGGLGAEGAWLSAQALLDAMTAQAPAPMAGRGRAIVQED